MRFTWSTAATPNEHKEEQNQSAINWRAAPISTLFACPCIDTWVVLVSAAVNAPDLFPFILISENRTEALKMFASQ